MQRIACTASNISKLKFKIVHFLVILVLLLLNIWGCGGQHLSSKSILKVKKQMSLANEHVHILFLTPWIVFVSILGFQSMALHYQTPCIKNQGRTMCAAYPRRHLWQYHKCRHLWLHSFSTQISSLSDGVSGCQRKQSKIQCLVPCPCKSWLNLWWPEIGANVCFGIITI